MSGFHNSSMTASYIPRRDDDRIERRRILNILAQRRYRKPSSIDSRP